MVFLFKNKVAALFGDIGHSKTTWLLIKRREFTMEILECSWRFWRNQNSCYVFLTWMRQRSILGKYIKNSHSHCEKISVNHFHRGSINIKCNSPLDTSAWNVYTLCGRGYEIQVKLQSLSVKLKVSLPLWKTLDKSSTGGGFQVE